MQYKGHELKVITEPQIFDPPKEMLVWDDGSHNACIANVYAIGPRSMMFPVRTINLNSDIEGTQYQCCAEIPKPRRATMRELAKWLAQGNGEMKVGELVKHYFFEIKYYEEDFPSYESWKIRKWEDTEWHEPTIDYMGLEEV